MSGDTHLTLDELAELDEGLLAPERELEVRNHLDGCAPCRAQADAIAATRGALAGVGPAEMPGEVAARIDQALADAAGATGTGPAAFDPSAAGTVVPDLTEVRNPRRLPSAPTAAAASIAVLAVVAIVIGVHHKSSDTTNAGTSAAAGSTAESPLVLVPPSSDSSTFDVQSSNRLYSPTTLGQSVGALVRQGTQTGLNTAPEPAANPTEGVTSAGRRSGSPGSGGGTRSYSAGSTAAGTAPRHKPEGGKQDTTSTNAAAPTDGTPLQALPPALQPYRSPNVIRACAAFITTTNGATPIVADLARWTDPAAGKHNIPAVIMVFPDAHSASKYDVYVVEPPCGNGDLLELLVVDKPR